MSIEQIDGSLYPEGMSDQDVARFRAQAEECRQQAERAISLREELWLQLNSVAVASKAAITSTLF